MRKLISFTGCWQHLRPWVLAVLLTPLAACISNSDENLFQALGGHAGIARITDNFIMEIANDEQVIDYFADSNVQRFREKIEEHFCQIADGPCEYTGDTMIQVHTGMNIGEADFSAVVDNLIIAMDKAEIPIAAQNRLLARLAPLRSEIIHL